jgi:hypothetical protein
MLQLTHVLTVKLTLVQELGVRSELLESCLPISERLLQSRANQKGLQLVRRVCESDVLQFRSVLDFLYVLCAPSWRPHVEAFYKDSRFPRLVEMADQTTITAIDEGVARCIRELTALHAQFTVLGWRETVRTSEFENLALEGIRHFITPDMPLASAVTWAA